MDSNISLQAHISYFSLKCFDTVCWATGSVVVKTFLDLETETLDFRSRDQDRDLGLQVSRPRPWPSGLETKTWTKWTRVHLSLETMVSKLHHWLYQFQLVTDHSLKGATNYGNRAKGVPSMLSWDQDRDLGLQVSRPRPRPWTSGLETKAEIWAFRSRDQDRDLGHQVSRLRPGQNEVECTRVSRPWSRDHNTGNRKVIRPVLVCWFWHFDWDFLFL